MRKFGQILEGDNQNGEQGEKHRDKVQTGRTFPGTSPQ